MSAGLLTVSAFVVTGSFCFLTAGEPFVAPPPRARSITLRLEKGESVVGLCFSADNRKLYAAVREKDNSASRVHVYDLATRERRYFGGHGSGGDILRLTWSDRDGRVLVWQREQVTKRDAGSGTVCMEVRADRGLRYERWNGTGDDLTGFTHRGGDFSGRFVPLGDSVLVVGPNSSKELTLRLVPFTNPKARVRDFDLPRTNEVPAPDGETLTLSPDGAAAAMCSSSADPESLSGVWVWNTRSGKRAHEFVYRTRADLASHTHPLAVGRGGTFIVSGTVFGPIHVFDTRCGKAAHLCEPKGRVQTLVCSPAADVFAAGTNKAVELWSLESGKKLAAWSRDDAGGYASAVTFSPDGSRLAWGSLREGVIQVTRLPGGE
ncbi:hypothetical protein GobsT_57950 [Gemmata obscuriglobus]|uniref:WD40 repeat domain-containing protein n=1 Tax=Gemmata obscuriglobus TaxID=114 RepID=A0A2Z3GQ44_9BACT|nr:WD40 repeat domain-containing protein [Gemmata obscuriglobus]AWM36409.1 WD40 repeat domain-containing protein [Gemmata obscuriglobus]QEG30976.1 hypothetical protein GobsT_57950 [Gemmata obscuriglobus]VTS10311.1 wd40 repeat-containing protein : WD40 repeat-containing protein OS=Oscillatoria acuminata PCC 6304 GN=Oscil6304_2579 PE=4 SV=1 [Gemmata obscuriglobus UQM 2246]